MVGGRRMLGNRSHPEARFWDTGRSCGGKRFPRGIGSLPGGGGGGGGAAEGSGEHQAMEKNVCKVQRLETPRCVEQLQVFQCRWLEGWAEAAVRLEGQAAGSWRLGVWWGVCKWGLGAGG